MQFLPMSTLLGKAALEGYAVPAFCVWNADVMETVLSVAEHMVSPVILMNGPAEFGLMAPRDMGAVAHALSRRFDVPAALHLDHGSSLEDVEACLSAGYTSVMLDYSARPYDENVSAMKEAVRMASAVGATVEGELGVVGRVDTTTTEGGKTNLLTDPDEAVAFVEATGIDALAVAIGNAHGHYSHLPELDFDLLAQLHKRLSIPLVLHGGTGTPGEDLRKAISLGIAKVNVASDLVSSVRNSIMEQWNSGINLWAPAAQAVACKSLASTVENWILRVRSAGRA